MRPSVGLGAALLVAGTSLTALTLATSPAESAMSSATHDLGTLGGYDSVPTAVDGRIVVGSSSLDPELSWPGEPRHAFAYDLDAPDPGMIDLGTLDGLASEAAAVEGSRVVGTSGHRAFLYDLAAPDPEMVDLGTLGGTTSSAADIEGGVVVGAASLPDGHQHAYALDLTTPSPAMVDLGVLDGGSSFAEVIDDGVVIGTSSVGAERHEHAFAFDLQNPTAGMVDLGTLGGDMSRPRAVDGHVVVGESRTRDGRDMAFAYDLDQGMMLNLGTLGGSGSSAAGVSGSLVVGTSDANGEDVVGQDAERAFVYDLNAPGQGMRAVGTLGWSSEAVAIDGSLVVGSYLRMPDGAMHAFVVDLEADPVEAMTDLGTLGGRHSQAVTANDGTVVGWSRTGEKPGGYTIRAAAWTVADLHLPGVEFSRQWYRVGETGRIATVEVHRTGPTDTPVTVRYRATTPNTSPMERPARGGVDFKTVSGTLRFAPGDLAKTFSVPILDDDKAEPRELVLLSLHDAGGGVLGTPRVSGLLIGLSDQQPDAQIGRGFTSGFVGDNIYNTTARRQTLRVTTARGDRRSFFVKIDHDGNSPAWWVIHGSEPPKGTRLRYFHGDEDITKAMRSSGGLRVLRASSSNDPGYDAYRIRIEMDVLPGARVSSSKVVAVSTTWTGDTVLKDRVRGVVVVVR